MRILLALAACVLLTSCISFESRLTAESDGLVSRVLTILDSAQK